MPLNEKLAQLLPVLADYPGPSWDVTLTVGAPGHVPGPYVDPNTTVDPPGCADIPFQRGDLIAASSDGIVQNGIAGNAGEAAVRIMHEQPGTDLIAESVAWAQRCREYREGYDISGADDVPMSSPTAVSVLPPIQIDGVEVTRIHLTDNRPHRYQGEGTRESVISLARAHGVVVVGYRHDRGRESAAILALTIRRLASDRPTPKPLVDKADPRSLTDRSDKEVQRLLPASPDVPPGWTVRQSSPIIRDLTDDGETASDCSRVPFKDSVGWRSDLHRHFREIASALSEPAAGKHTDRDIVTLGIEKPGASIIDETTTWATECDFEILPTPRVDGIDVTSIHIKGGPPSRIDFTASLLRVRGLLVITQPALNEHSTQLARQTIDNLRHAQFDTPPTGPDVAPRVPDPHARPPGDVEFPQPTSEATTALAQVGHGTLVNPEPYHVGGYLSGDAATRSSNDYLHFRSPSGAIACTWRKYALYCDLPHGTFPRTPTPIDLQGSWQESVIGFGWNGLQNGVTANDPIVYAESNVLPYDSTIRLVEGTECLMKPDGLTCVEYDRRIGFHLSRDDLTPLADTDALVTDTRPQPN